MCYVWLILTDKEKVQTYLNEWVERHGKANLRPSTFATYKGYIKNHINGFVISKPDGAPERRDKMSSNFGQLIRRLELPHIRFHDLRHSAATNMHQLTGDFYTVGEILGHTLKGIGMTLGISGNLESTTARYVDVRLDRKMSVLSTYHNEIMQKKEMNENTHKDNKKKNNEIDL